MAFGLGLTLAVAYWLSREAPQASQANLRLRQLAPADARIDQDLLCQRWRWVRTVDDYQGGTSITPPPAAEPRWLVFHADGRYQRLEETQHQEGVWQLGTDGKRLALLEGAHTLRQDLPTRDYRHEIRQLTRDSLALAWQGRHGYVVEQYVAADRQEDDEQGLSLAE